MHGHGRSRRLRRQTLWSFLAMVALLGAVFTAWVAVPASAATSFASPLFQTKWQTDEAVTQNFWGPLQNARDGQAEPYVEGVYNGAAGQRLVQYFDKGRMELTNPATNTVTSGLLATELITGKLQSGDSTFQTLQPAGVPIAGDPDNIGPTYASISANAAALQSPTTSTPGVPTTRLLGPTGTLGTYTGAAASDPQANIATFDATTQHNVPAAFLNFRNKVNLLNIGFAISEPFWSNVKVAGTQKDVLVQAFERRVLTYTPTNNDPFKVEFGNIGQHYYAWRQSPQVQATATPSVTATPTVTADTTAPKFTGAPETPYQTPNSMTVTWKTNEPASSEVKYGTSTNYEGINDKLKGFFTYDHYVVITGLTPGGTYHYRIQSRDAAGNLTVDDQDRAITLPTTAVLPVNSNITVTKKTATTFTVTWTTNVATYSRIEYGSANGIYDRFRKGDGGDPLGTGHAATAISLEPGKVYYFRVVSILNTPRADAIASDDAPTPLTNNTAPTATQTAALTISDLKATQDKVGGVTSITFSTDRPASVVIVIGPTSKLDTNLGVLYGPADDYAYPFTRNLHNISVQLPAGTWYYRVTVYDEQGTGTSDIKTAAIT
jgi:hypothetical protein